MNTVKWSSQQPFLIVNVEGLTKEYMKDIIHSNLRMIFEILHVVESSGGGKWLRPSQPSKKPSMRFIDRLRNQLELQIDIN